MTNEEHRKLRSLMRKIEHARLVRNRLPESDLDGFAQLTNAIARYIDQYASLTGGHS